MAEITQEGLHYDATIDTADLNKSVSEVLGKLNQIDKKAEQTGSKMDAAFKPSKNFSELEQHLANLKNELKEVQEEIQKGGKYTGDLVAREGDLRAEISRVTKEISLEREHVGNLSGSIDGLQAKLKSLNAEFNQLSPSSAFGAEGKLLQKEIKETEMSIDRLKGKQEQLSKEMQLQKQIFTSAPGSINQYKASIQLLTMQYDKLSEAERKSASGQALLKQLNDNKAGLEAAKKTMTDTGNAATGMGTKVVAGAGKAFSFLKNIAYLIPGLGLAGLIGLLIEPLTKFVAGLFKGGSAIQRLKQEVEDLKKAQQSANQTAGEQIGKLTTLNNVLQSNTASAKAKKGAYDQLIKMYPSYADQLKDEYEKTGNVANVIKDQLVPAIIAAARARAYQARIDELSSKNLDLQDEQLRISKEQNKAAQQLSKTQKESEAAKNIDGEAYQFVNEQLKAAQGNVDKLKGQWRDLHRQEQANTKQIEVYADSITKIQPKLGSLTSDGTDAGTYAAKEKKAKRDAEAKRLLENQKRLREDIARAEISLTYRMEDEGTKQLAAIKTKYDKMVADAKKYKLSLDEIIKIEKLRTREVEVYKYEQETKKIIDGLNQQKDAYKSYEDFKLKAGKEAADKLYKDQIDTSKTFIQTVQDQARELLTKQSVGIVTGNQLSSIEAERLTNLLKILTQAQAEETKAQSKWMEQALTDYASYEQKKSAITERYKAQREQAIKSGNATLLDGINAAEREELKALQASNSEKLAATEQFAAGAVYLTKKAVQQQIEILQKLLDSGGLPADATENIKKKIEDLNELLNKPDSGFMSSQLDEEIKKKEAALLELAKSGDVSSEAVKRLNDELMRLKQEKAENSITGLTQALSVLSKIAPALNDLSSALSETNNHTARQIGGVFASLANGATNLLQTIKEIETQGVDTIDAIGTAANFVISTIANIVSSAQAQKKAYEEFYLQNLAYQHDYNNALIDEIRLREGIKDSVFFTDYAGKIKAGLAAEIKAVNDYNEALKKLNDAQVITGTKKVRDWAAVAASTAAGAGAGAVVGSAGGPLSAVGAAVGGLVGFIGGMLKKRTVVNVYDGLLKTYPKLIDEQGNLNKAMAEAIISSGKIEGSSRENLQYLISMNEQYEAAREQIEGVISDLAGSLGSDLMGSLFDDWAKGGENAGKAFTDGVSKSLANIGKNLLFNAVFGDDFVALQNKIKEGFKTTGDPNEMVKALLDFNDEAKDKGKQFQDLLSEYSRQLSQRGIEDVFGLAGLQDEKSGSNTNTLSKGIKAITQDQADILGATTKGMQVSLLQVVADNKRLVDLGVQKLSYLQKIEVNTYKTATAVISLDNKIKSIDDVKRAAGIA